MANLNGTSEQDKYLKGDSIQLGLALLPDQLADFEIEWGGTAEDIEHVHGACGCTDAWYDDGKIKGTINIARSNFNRETGVVGQFVYVYLKDGEPFYLGDSRKRRQDNPAKKWLRINLNGKVSLEEKK